MTFTLPSLNFSTDALEPHIDARTMEIHHGKHHQTYINNLNAALDGQDQYQSSNIEDLISDISALPDALQGPVRNNGGGHANHSFFWASLSPNGGGLPSGTLADSINSTFGNLDAMKDAFTKAALTRFGSGWAWLIQRSDGTLAVTSTPNQDSPLRPEHLTHAENLRDNHKPFAPKAPLQEDVGHSKIGEPYFPEVPYRR